MILVSWLPGVCALSRKCHQGAWLALPIPLLWLFSSSEHDCQCMNWQSLCKLIISNYLVITNKLCGFVKTHGFIFFLRGCAMYSEWYWNLWVQCYCFVLVSLRQLIFSALLLIVSSQEECTQSLSIAQESFEENAFMSQSIRFTLECHVWFTLWSILQITVMMMPVTP